MMDEKQRLRFWQRVYIAAIQGASAVADPTMIDENEYATSIADQAVMDCQEFWEDRA